MSTELWKDVLDKVEIQYEYPNKEENTLDNEILDIYNRLALILRRYRYGKLPKAFKVIPSLKNWEQLLEYTRPENWTPNATYQATRIFVSTLNPKLAARF